MVGPAVVGDGARRRGPASREGDARRREGTRLARAQALKTYFLFVELRHKVEIHQLTGRVVVCPIDVMNRPPVSSPVGSAPTGPRTAPTRGGSGALPLDGLSGAGPPWPGHRTGPQAPPRGLPTLGTSGSLQLWQLDIMGSVMIADPAAPGGVVEAKLISGIDDHSRCAVIAKVVPRASARAVCVHGRIGL